MAHPTEFHIFLFKRGEELLIKGLSFDKKNWFRMPKDVRNLVQHPLIYRYKAIKACYKQSKVERIPTIKITKDIKREYMTEDGKFMFQGKLLELDSSITEDTFIKANENDNLNKSLAVREASTPVSTNSNDFKRRRITFIDTIDVDSIITTLLDEVGKFVLFKEQPEVYLSKIVEYFTSNDSSSTHQLDNIVNHFSKLIESSMHEWFWEDVFRQGHTFAEFSVIFVEHVNRLMYRKISNVHLNLEDYLVSISADTENNRFQSYFDSKLNLLLNYFNMGAKEAKLMAISALDFDDYLVFLSVLNDDPSFKSLIKYQDKKFSANLPPEFFNLSDEDEVANPNNEADKDKNELNKKIKRLEQEVIDLQTQNNNYSSNAIELDNKISELNKEIEIKDNELDALKIQIKEIDVLKTKLKTSENELVRLNNELKSKDIQIVNLKSDNKELNDKIVMLKK